MTTREDLPRDMPKPTLVARYRFPIKVNSTVGPVIEARIVDFVPVDNVPGFTHRVLIDELPRDWLGYGKPSARAAEYFLRKHWTLS